MQPDTNYLSATVEVETDDQAYALFEGESSKSYETSYRIEIMAHFPLYADFHEQKEFL